jgi:hypothetical protein
MAVNYIAAIKKKYYLTKFCDMHTSRKREGEAEAIGPLCHWAVWIGTIRPRVPSWVVCVPKLRQNQRSVRVAW